MSHRDPATEIHTHLDAAPGTIIGIVEDDLTESNQLSAWLSADGYTPREYASAEAYQADAASSTLRLLLLDWQLPGASGVELMQWMRANKRETPVIFITGRASEIDIVTAFRAGADDYLIKPLRNRETLARVAAMLRRVERDKPAAALNIGAYSLNPQLQSITLRGEPVELRNREFKLALMLFQSINLILPRAQIASALSAYGPLDTSRTVDTQIYRLRKKLELSPTNGVMLQTVYNVGYRLVEVADADDPPSRMINVE